MRNNLPLVKNRQIETKKLKQIIRIKKVDQIKICFFFFRTYILVVHCLRLNIQCVTIICNALYSKRCLIKYKVYSCHSLSIDFTLVCYFWLHDIYYVNYIIKGWSFQDKYKCTRGFALIFLLLNSQVYDY